MYESSFISLLDSQRHAPDNFYCKITQGGRSVNTGGRVMVQVFCNFFNGPLSVYQVLLPYLQYFLRYAPDKSVNDRRWTKRQL